MSSAPRLEVIGLALRAGGATCGRPLFGELGFTVRPGDRWVVLGPNGAGKSSLLAALAHVFPIDAGAIHLQERPLASWSPSALADARAWCPQFWSDPFPSTVRETAAMAQQRGDWWSRSPQGSGEVDEVLRRLDLVALAQADVRQLSGGERQRVAIATALLQGAPLLLLDEPASHLDLAHQHLLVRLLIERSAAGGSVVASLHDINLAWDLASHAVLLDGHGQCFAGAREDVMTPPRLSQAFGVAIERVKVCGQARFWVQAPIA